MASNVFQNVHPHFNPEEAAYAAAEFVGSLDNLPGEVTFLLEEISEKDRKITSLMTRINLRHYTLTKNIKSAPPSSQPSTPGTPTFVLPIPAGAELPVGHLSQKEQQAITKIIAEWAKVEQIQLEKIKLAQRLEQITSRARERGRAEWKKVGGMDLDEIEKSEGPRNGFGEMGGTEVLLPPSGLGSGSDGRPKKRKPNALPLPLPSAPIMHPPPASMLPPPAPRPSLSARQTSSRHGRNFSTSTLSEDPDGDGEMESAEAEGEGEADDTLYCFCQQRSYGEMIGCDNSECEYEWFHVKCVNMSGELPETWFCPACVTKLGFASSDGSLHGQKKASSRRR